MLFFSLSRAGSDGVRRRQTAKECPGQESKIRGKCLRYIARARIGGTSCPHLVPETVGKVIMSICL